MSDDTIASGQTFALNAPLNLGTNIDFLNNAGASGELAIDPCAFVIDTTGWCQPTLYGASLGGGDIQNFQPGDVIDLKDVDQLYAELNVSPWNWGDNVIFDNAAFYAAYTGGEVFIAPDGAVTDNFGAPVDSATQTIFDDIREALFGTGADGATLTMSFEANGFLSPDAIITTGSDINPCFTRGTRILTTAGDIAVEELAVGDTVINRKGEEREIIWIGTRDIDISRHPRPEAVLPVIIEAGALGENCPSRRLTLSPDHGLYIDGVLVQPKDLLNGVSIRQVTSLARIRYYHIELECHDVLFAEGAAAESYLDTGHRGVFDNAEAPIILHPDLMQIRREAEGCAPLCTGGETLFRIRNRLADRLWHTTTLAVVNA
jgi:hypothetical protein